MIQDMYFKGNINNAKEMGKEKNMKMEKQFLKANIEKEKGMETEEKLILCVIQNLKQNMKKEKN